MKTYNIILSAGIIFLFLSGCKRQKINNGTNATSAHIEISAKTLHFDSSSTGVLNLKSYSVSQEFNDDTSHNIIGYNYRTHSLDIINITKKIVTSVQLQKEGSNGISGEPIEILPVNNDSIWIYDDTQQLYLIDIKGKVKDRIALLKENEEQIIIENNHAISTSEFYISKARHSILYPVSKGKDFLVKEMDFYSKKIIKKYMLQPSAVFPDGPQKCANMCYPNVNYTDSLIIYNYPFESDLYVINTNTDKRFIIEASSKYVSNIAKACENESDYSKWERHGIENTHFYDVMFLSKLNAYVRIHIGGVRYDAQKSLQELSDSRSIYLMLFNSKFKKLGEWKLKDRRYNYYKGWCSLSDAIAIFVNNSINKEKEDDSLNLDLIKFN